MNNLPFGWIILHTEGQEYRYDACKIDAYGRDGTYPWTRIRMGEGVHIATETPEEIDALIREATNPLKG